ncbi:cobalamin biosynthesis protein CobD/CbiB [Shewanella donghaensis]|uniref:cobalamin biosynthesis protein CobD/CbiB n=1 Tax=Shewanella donghaensis TaxID=238836 RepID=UPI001181EA0F|nr:cobalamin biosynthesis protein [Shewanella donghaensis]
MALLISRVAPIPRQMQPIVFFHLLAKQLSAKVNHPQRSHKQQFIAGLLASILLIFPLWFVVYFILSLAAYPWFFDFVLLYFCISDAGFKPVASDVINALEDKDKPQARKLLTPWLAQQTNQLSDIGICKATIERLLISPSYGTVATILFFAIGGAPLVLFLHLLKQLEHCWPNYAPQYRYFSAAIYALNRMIFALPCALWNITLVLQGGVKNLSTLFKQPKHSLGVYGYSSLFIGSKILEVELGGPQKMNFSGTEQRIDINKINQSRMPVIKDIENAISLTSWAVTFWISFTIAIPIIWTTLRWFQSM